jgi:hypothetical protein
MRRDSRNTFFKFFIFFLILYAYAWVTERFVLRNCSSDSVPSVSWIVEGFDMKCMGFEIYLCRLFRAVTLLEVCTSSVCVNVCTRFIPKVMSPFIIQWNEGIHTKTNYVSAVWADFIIFYRLSIQICTFLPALQNLKDASAVVVGCSSLQPASHGFLDCFVRLVVVTSQVIFQGPEQVVVWGGQIRSVGWMGEQFPAVLCSPVKRASTLSQNSQNCTDSLTHVKQRRAYMSFGAWNRFKSMLYNLLSWNSVAK